MDASAQTTLRGSLEPDIAAVAACHVTGDRQAKTDTTGGRIARRIEPRKGPKHPIPVGFWNSGSVVVDNDIDPIGDSDAAQPHVTTVTAGVADQIAETAP